VVIPHFYPGAVHSNYWYRYESLGSSPGVAIVNVLLHPWLLFATFLTLDRFYYIVSLIRSTGFFSLLAPEWLLPAIPALAINLFSDYPLYYSGVYHYNAVIIPFVMLSTIHGLRRFWLLWNAWRSENVGELTSASVITRETRLARWFARELPLLRQWMAFMQTAKKWTYSAYTFIQNAIQPVLARPIFASTLTQVQQTNVVRLYQEQRNSIHNHAAPLAKQVSLTYMQWLTNAWIVLMLALNLAIMAPQLNVFWADHTPGVREQHINQLLAMIPPSASVSAGENLNPHLSERLYITVFPSITYSTSKNTNNTVQYIVVDVQNVIPEERVGVSNTLNQLVNSGQFRPLAEAEGVKLLVRRNTT
jgi:hypothetical protein